MTLCALVSGGATPAFAAAFTVTSTVDSVDASPGDGLCADSAGRCTLRAAIQETNALPGADGITVPAGTYTLTIPGREEDASTTGDLDIGDDLTIMGAGAEATALDGNQLDRVLDVRTGKVRLLAVRVQNGDSGEEFGGGGIVNRGVLDVANSTIDGNRGVFAGGIVNIGTLSMANGTVSDNTGTIGIGGVYSVGTLSMNNVLIVGNLAVEGDVGGLGTSGDAFLTDVTVSGNRVNEFLNMGGGILNDGMLSLTRSLVSGNQAWVGGGIFAGGELTLFESTIERNTAQDGAGLFNYAGEATMFRSTISSNTASAVGGGIVITGGSLAATNSTVSGNTASRGGGIYYELGSLHLHSSTVSANGASLWGGGIQGDVVTTFTIQNTIVADNAGGDCGGVLPTSNGHNLDGDGSCGLTGTGDLSATDPLLGPLSHNGGRTLTHALLPGSPAIDAGDNEDCPFDDQRGLYRPAGSGCDIGAFEADASLPDPGPPLAVGGAAGLIEGEAAPAQERAEERSVGGGPPVAVLAGAAAAAVVLLGGGWYARRRLR